MRKAPNHRKLPSPITLTLPRLHPAQQHIVAQAQRFNIICAGRRIGKTVLGIDRLVQPALDGSPVAWMSPTYRMLTEVWRTVRDTMAPVTQATSEQQHRLELLTGGVIEMWSLEKADVIRGRKYKRIIIDEAAMVRHLEMAWQQVIRPTLTDMQGDVWMLSTPKGRNFFWECFQRGQEQQGEWRSWQMPTHHNPHIPPSELEAMRQELPEQVYRQEIEAQFLDMSGGVFRRGLEAATGEAQDTAQPGQQYVMGVDWARAGDFTCFIVMNRTTRTMVYLDRFTDTDFAVQMARLHALYKRFHPTLILAEQNSLGLPLVEQLARDGLPIQGMNTTNASKATWIDALVLAFEQGDIAILSHPVLLGELMAFEAERLAGGRIRYAAPPGQHDDTVMALALAWQGCVGGDTSLLCW
jgi:hypothetical protein